MRKALLVTAAAAAVLSMASSSMAQTIAAANATATGTSVTVDDATISNVLSSSTTTFTLDLQDATGGVLAYKFPIADFTGGFTPAAGDVVDFTANNAPYEGDPELSGTGATVSLVSSGTFMPAMATTSQVNAATSISDPLLGTTVTIPDVVITDATGTTGSTFTSGGTYDATDASGTTEVYIANSDTAVAALEGQTIPTGAVNLTGFVDYFSSGSVIEIYPIATSPVPEPASLGLIAISALGLGARRRRAAR